MNEAKRQKIQAILRDEPLSIQNDAFCFVEGDALPRQTTASGVYGRVQEFFKKRPRLYDAIVSILAPVKSSAKPRRLEDALFARHGEDHVIVNYGSGPRTHRGRRDAINVDIFAFDAVDVVSDTALPFKDESIDFLFSVAVLEHLRRPEAAVADMLRRLKPGGELLVYTPFLQPFHAAPHDYRRWTIPGLRELFRDFEILDCGVAAGPTSGLLWVFQEWLSLALSFGCSPLKDAVLIAAMLTTFPVKYLDVLLERHPRAADAASAYYIHARKRET